MWPLKHGGYSQILMAYKFLILKLLIQTIKKEKHSITNIYTEVIGLSLRIGGYLFNAAKRSTFYYY